MIPLPNFAELFGSIGTTEHVVTIDDIVIDGATMVEKSGGWDAPSEKVERGFDFSSYVQADPVKATLEAWVEKDTLDDLEDLREKGEPFSATIDNVGLPEAKLNDLRVTNESNRLSHFQVSIEIEEVRFAETESAEVVFESDGDTLSSNAEGTSPSVAGSTESDDPTGGGGGVLGSIESATSNLADSIF